jgi:hypothetical protein
MSTKSVKGFQHINQKKIVYNLGDNFVFDRRYHNGAEVTVSGTPGSTTANIDLTAMKNGDEITFYFPNNTYYGYTETYINAPFFLPRLYAGDPISGKVTISCVDGVRYSNFVVPPTVARGETTAGDKSISEEDYAISSVDNLVIVTKISDGDGAVKLPSLEGTYREITIKNLALSAISIHTAGTGEFINYAASESINLAAGATVKLVDAIVDAAAQWITI